MSLSRPTTEKIRGGIIGLIAPVWEKITFIKNNPTQYVNKNNDPKTPNTPSPEEELQRLRLDNQLLNNELYFLSELLKNKQSMDLSIQTTTSSVNEKENEKLETSYQQYVDRLKKNVNARIQAVPARVIFRSLDMWDSLLWINIGDMHNQYQESPTIAKNSPVMVGHSIIGVIDYVGKYQSRVRLITDSRLIPSVRAARGGEQDAYLIENIEMILNNLNPKKDSSLSESERRTIDILLTKIKSTLSPTKHSWYIAKGELQGSLRPSGRSSGQILKGVGFNYDFSDEEGLARDLRTGKLMNQSRSESLPILKINDLLVTTGMDGVFPPYFKVATITKIHLLKEGDYYYELEATPTAGNLNELSLVFVLPPVGYDKEEAVSISRERH